MSQSSEFEAKAHLYIVVFACHNPSIINKEIELLYNKFIYLTTCVLLCLHTAKNQDTSSKNIYSLNKKCLAILKKQAGAELCPAKAQLGYPASKNS